MEKEVRSPSAQRVKARRPSYYITELIHSAELGWEKLGHSALFVAASTVAIFSLLSIYALHSFKELGS